MELLKSNVSFELPEEYKIVSLGTGESYCVGTEETNLTIEVLPEQASYNTGQTASVDVRMVNNTNEAFDDLLLWFFVPEENLVVKETISLEAQSESTQSYEFEVSSTRRSNSLGDRSIRLPSSSTMRMPTFK